MNTERTVLYAGIAVLGLAALIGFTGPARAVGDSGGIASLMPNPASVLRWCGQEQEGTRQMGHELQRRARGLDERERSIVAREAELGEAEKRLDARLAELTAIRDAVGKQLDAADEEREQRIAGLVTMVEKARPTEVAPLFARLDTELAVDVLERMKRAKAGKLLVSLDPAVAALLAARMTDPILLDGIPDPRATTTAPGAVAAPSPFDAPAAAPPASPEAPAAPAAAPGAVSP
jgi:flagellar motility protein MotE (MotC chaperone)